MRFKEPIVFKKSFTYGKYTVKDVPFHLRGSVSEPPIDEDLIVSGPVMLRLMKILGHMEQNDLLIFDYDNEI